MRSLWCAEPSNSIQPLVQARRNLVLVLVDQGRMEDARASLRQAIDTSGHRAEYRDLVQELQPEYP